MTIYRQVPNTEWGFIGETFQDESNSILNTLAPGRLCQYKKKLHPLLQYWDQTYKHANLSKNSHQG